MSSTFTDKMSVNSVQPPSRMHGFLDKSQVVLNEKKNYLGALNDTRLLPFTSPPLHTNVALCYLVPTDRARITDTYRLHLTLSSKRTFDQD